MTQDQIQGKILAYMSWEGYLSLEEISLHTKLLPLVCKENIYRLIIRKMIAAHPKDHSLLKKRPIND